MFADSLEILSKHLAKNDCECVLSFDEMDVENVLKYDPDSAEMLEPHNFLQLVMARDPAEHWILKQNHSTKITQSKKNLSQQIFFTRAEISPIFPDVEEMKKVNGIIWKDSSDVLSSVSSAPLSITVQEGDGL
uniref:Uncharacterized protein n=1 Tax=Anopheles dirus TaxID=7168 RepID=A0A182NMW8_9DIPT